MYWGFNSLLYLLLWEDVNRTVSVTHQGNMTESGLCTEGEVRDPEGVECGERAN